jgi:SAM-dependent methyltransferase
MSVVVLAGWQAGVVSVEHFDEWYSAMSAYPDARDALVHAHLGLPTEIRSTSLLGMPGLLEVRDLLQLSAQDIVVDLACGRLWLARESDAGVLGVDFSAVAVDLARHNVATFGLTPPEAKFRVGTLTATGLPDGTADALVCIDAIQFADDIVGAAAECVRVVRPGGRVVLTCWEAIDRGDDRVPQRCRRVDLAAQLTAGGLVEIRVVDRPTWLEVEHRMWSEAAALDPGDDPALQD